MIRELTKFFDPSMVLFSGDLLLAQAPPGPPSGSAARAEVDPYCITCHSDKLRTGVLPLQSIDIRNPSGGRETWEKVPRKLHAGAMPAAAKPNPGRATLH
jgi:hypothetical protein